MSWTDSLVDHHCLSKWLSTPIFRKLGVKLGNQLQFKYDIEQNTFSEFRIGKWGKPMEIYEGNVTQ
jgi:hypothetical protein